MFKEVFYFVPRVSNSDAAKTERVLNSRFDRVAKRFGQGMKKAFAAGSVIAFGAAIVDKILSPLQEVKEAIDKTLGRADDLGDQAEQFNSTTGRLFKLQQLAKAKGVDAGDLNELIQKFQTAVAEANADPTKATAVRAFTGEKDSVLGLFKFLQALDRAPKDQSLLAQKEVFGERKIGKTADLINSSEDYRKILGQVAPGSAAHYSKIIDPLNKTADFDQIQKTAMEGGNFLTTGKRIDKDIVTQTNMLQAEKDRLLRENITPGGIQAMVSNDRLIAQAADDVKNLALMIGKIVPLMEIYFKSSGRGASAPGFKDK